MKRLLLLVLNRLVIAGGAYLRGAYGFGPRERLFRTLGNGGIGCREDWPCATDIARVGEES